MREAIGAIFRKSSFSQGGRPDCVEFADNLPGVVVFRDSKNPADGAEIVVDRNGAGTAFIHAVKNDRIAAH